MKKFHHAEEHAEDTGLLGSQLEAPPCNPLLERLKQLIRFDRKRSTKTDVHSLKLHFLYLFLPREPQ
jgi:hypothetical protein